MKIQDKLQIILITYNREKYAKKTLNTFLAGNCPVKDCELIIIDNNSTDNTENMSKKYSENFKNVSYIKNRYNVGISGNILKAMEYANKDYVWVIGDDDVYDFSNWSEVEKSIENNEKLICLSRYVISDEKKEDIATQLFQLTFITSAIYQTSLFNDMTIRNAYDNTYTLFPHMLPIFDYINKGGKIYVVEKWIADNGLHYEIKDCSYVRGMRIISDLHPKTQKMSWILGYANALAILNNKNLIAECLETAISYKDIFPNWTAFYNYMNDLHREHPSYFYEIFNGLSEQRKKELFSRCNIISIETVKDLSDVINVMQKQEVEIQSLKK